MKTLATLILILSSVAVHAGNSDGGYGKPKVTTNGAGGPCDNDGRSSLKIEAALNGFSNTAMLSPLSKLESNSDGGFGKGAPVAFSVLKGARSIQVLGDLPTGEIIFTMIDQNQNGSGYVIHPGAIGLMDTAIGNALKQSLQTNGQKVILSQGQNYSFGLFTSLISLNK